MWSPEAGAPCRRCSVGRVEPTAGLDRRKPERCVCPQREGTSHCDGDAMAVARTHVCDAGVAPCSLCWSIFVASARFRLRRRLRRCRKLLRSGLCVWVFGDSGRHIHLHIHVCDKDGAYSEEEPSVGGLCASVDGGRRRWAAVPTETRSCRPSGGGRSDRSPSLRRRSPQRCGGCSGVARLGWCVLMDRVELHRSRGTRLGIR